MKIPFIIIIILLLSCDEIEQPEHNPLQNTNWYLASVTLQNGTKTGFHAVLDSALSILHYVSFDETEYSGIDQCNSFGGNYLVEENKINF